MVWDSARPRFQESERLLEMIEIRRQGDGYIIPFIVEPGAARNRIFGQYGERVKIAVTAPPEGGKANDALRKLLSRSLGVNRSQVQIVSGHRSRRKEVLIERVDKSTLEAILV